MFVPDYYVYTDGSCSNNGQQNPVAGIGIFFGTDDDRNVSRRIDGKQTNNTAELSAIIQTYPIIENDTIHKKVMIVTDSEYAIKCITSYGEKCSNQRWEKDIPNKNLVMTIYETYKNKPNIQFMHVRAHTNNTDVHSIGNFNADKLANMAVTSDKNNVQINEINNTPNRVDRMKQIQEEALKLFIRKNADYGDAFAKYGTIGVLMRIEDKIQRALSITKNGITLVNDEGIKDTLIDLHNYSAMALMLIDE
jgi:ribonuclease HI